MVSKEGIHVTLLDFFPLGGIFGHLFMLCFEDLKFTVSHRFFLLLKGRRFVGLAYLPDGLFLVDFHFPHEGFYDLCVLIFEKAVLVILFFLQVSELIVFGIQLMDGFGFEGIHILLLDEVCINFSSLL
jgi:hypothetical protein